MHCNTKCSYGIFQDLDFCLFSFVTSRQILPLWVWIYCIIWWFIQDLAKVLTLWTLNHFKICPNFLADMAPYEAGAEQVV